MRVPPAVATTILVNQTLQDYRPFFAEAHIPTLVLFGRDNKLTPEGWFKQHLSKGCCLIMLDGLDEVADPEVRMAVVTWVERQMAAYSD